MRDPLGKFFWNVTDERLDAVNPKPFGHWLDREGGVYEFS
jgi:hypothetical protein